MFQDFYPHQSTFNWQTLSLCVDQTYVKSGLDRHTHIIILTLNITLNNRQSVAFFFAANMGVFSAICWLFGRNLNIQLGYPIGLIQSAWDGTRIEAWSAPEPLFECFGENGPP